MTGIHTLLATMFIAAVATAGTATAFADDSSMDAEIDYLISRVGTGGCTFLRNGRVFRGRDARAHLSSKRRRNAHLIDSTEVFIEKIASRSATTGKPYRIRCRKEAQQDAGAWFDALLTNYRRS